MEHKIHCAICGEEIPHNHVRLGSISRGDVCMKHECEDIEVFTAMLPGGGDVLYERDINGILALIENIEDDCTYVIGKQKINVVKYMSLPEFQGF